MSDELDLDAIEALVKEANAWRNEDPDDDQTEIVSERVVRLIGTLTDMLDSLLAEVKRLRATTPEWEYGYMTGDKAIGGWDFIQRVDGDAKPLSLEGARLRGKPVFQRTKSVPAGPWLPVPDLTPDNEGGA